MHGCEGDHPRKRICMSGRIYRIYIQMREGVRERENSRERSRERRRGN